MNKAITSTHFEVKRKSLEKCTVYHIWG